MTKLEIEEAFIRRGFKPVKLKFIVYIKGSTNTGPCVIIESENQQVSLIRSKYSSRYLCIWTFRQFKKECDIDLFLDGLNNNLGRLPIIGGM